MTHTVKVITVRLKVQSEQSRLTLTGLVLLTGRVLTELIFLTETSSVQEEHFQ
jgi:hypothetical protein